MRPIIQAIACIHPRAKPAKPSESQVVPCDPSTSWGPGYTQSRVCTFDYGLPFQWNCTDWVTTGGTCNPIPPKPPESQYIPCPPGFSGFTGQYQTRVCTFNYTSGVWECTGWATQSSDCIPNAIDVTFTFPTAAYVATGEPGYNISTQYGPYTDTKPYGGFNYTCQVVSNYRRVASSGDIGFTFLATFSTDGPVPLPGKSLHVDPVGTPVTFVDWDVDSNNQRLWSETDSNQPSGDVSYSIRMYG